MASALAGLKHEWKAFCHDTPGKRFKNHRKRMKQRSRWHSVGALIAGLVLVAGGIVLLFIPGPGTPLIAFGLALIGSHWKRLSDLLDRGEPRIHAAGRHIARHWKRLPTGAKTSIVLGGLALVAAGGLGMWHVLRHWV
jgi:hypothetical protein